MLSRLGRDSAASLALTGEMDFDQSFIVLSPFAADEFLLFHPLQQWRQCVRLEMEFTSKAADGLWVRFEQCEQDEVLRVG